MSGASPQRAIKKLGERALTQAEFTPLRKIAIEAHETLRTLPLFRALAGSVSLADIEAHVEEEGFVLYVSPTLGVRGKPERMVVRAGDADRAHLRRLIGSNRVRLGDEWLEDWRRRRAFEERPQLDSLELAKSLAFVSVELDQLGLKGSVGLPRADPALGVGPSIQVCQNLRPIVTTSPKLDLPVTAIVDGPDLGESSGFEAITKAEMRRVRSVCNSAVNRLLTAFAKGFPTFSDEDLESARPWALFLLAKFMARSRGDVKRTKRRVIREIAHLDVLQDSNSKWVSVAELRGDFKEHGSILVVEADSALPAPEQRRAIRLSTTSEAEALDEIFGKLSRWEDEHRRLESGARAREASRSLAAEDPHPSAGLLQRYRARSQGDALDHPRR